MVVLVHRLLNFPRLAGVVSFPAPGSILVALALFTATGTCGDGRDRHGGTPRGLEMLRDPFQHVKPIGAYTAAYTLKNECRKKAPGAFAAVAVFTGRVGGGP
jgi:hypothetical protein